MWETYAKGHSPGDRVKAQAKCIENMKKKSTKVVQIIISVLFVAAIVVVALFPFDNRNLHIKIVSDVETYDCMVTNVQLAEEQFDQYTFENSNSAVVKKIQIYGRLRTVLLKEISANELLNYIDLNCGDEEISWTDEGISIKNADNFAYIRFSESWLEDVAKISASFLQERLIMAGYILTIYILCLLCVSLLCESHRGAENVRHGLAYEAKKFAGDIKKYAQYMVYAAKTDLKAEVANSYLNRLWWLLEPFFNMLVYVIVFGNIMGNSVENYATFVFSALLMWNFFSKTVNYSVKLVRNNKDILTKVYIPKFVILISNMILNMYKLLFSMIVLVVMLFVFRVHIGFNIIWVIPSYIVIILLGTGIGMIFLHFGVYVDDLSYAVAILLNMLMFLSGIFYNVMATLPEPLNIVMMCVNPIAMLVDTMRNALLYNRAANLPILGMWFLLSVILCVIGTHIVYKNENSYAKVV